MKNKLSKRFFLFPTVLLLFFVIITVSYVPALAGPKPEGTLVIAKHSLGEEGFLPWIGASEQISFWELVYDHLVYIGMKTRIPIPGLAERWEMSKDASACTIWLRKGVSWHGGWGNVTAEDVKYSFERIMEKGSMNFLAKTLQRVIRSMEVVDPHTLVFYLQKPDPLFVLKSLGVSQNSFSPIICKKYVETVGDDKASKQPIGSGPYRLVEHRRGDYLKFEALDEHWRVVPEFKYIVMRAVPEESTRVAMLKTGEIDISQISPEKIDQVKKAGILTTKWPGGYSVWPNFGGMSGPDDKRYREGYHRQDPWVDIRVREAMNIAIDREAIVKSIYYGAATPAPIPWTIPGWDEQKPIPYDPEGAKRLLTEAGYPNGFSLEIYAYKRSPGAELPDVCEIIAGYWEQIGLTVKIRPIDHAAFRPDLRKGVTKGLIYPWRSVFVDDWTQRFHDYFVPGGSYVAFQSPELTALIKKYDEESVFEKKNAVSREIAKYMRDTYVAIPIAIANPIWAHTKKVGEWPANMSRHPENWVYIRHVKPLNTWRLFNP